jgi:hypothetical protein
MRQTDFVEAAVLAFKLNKLRDFYHIMNKVVVRSQKQKHRQTELDQVDSVIQDMEDFEQLAQLDFASTLSESKESQTMVTQIVERLLKENRLKFLQMIRNLNARYEYAPIAQCLMLEILPSIDAFKYLEEAKKDEKFLGSSDPTDKLMEIMQGTLVYQDKHKKRVERQHRSAYFVDYIVSQMTLQQKDPHETE